MIKKGPVGVKRGGEIAGVKALGWSPQTGQPLPSPLWGSGSSLISGVVESVHLQGPLSSTILMLCMIQPHK